MKTFEITNTKIDLIILNLHCPRFFVKQMISTSKISVLGPNVIAWPLSIIFEK